MRTARPGFFELTPGRRVFFAAAGVAALTVVGYVGDALETRQRLKDQREQPPPVPQPPLVSTSGALREAAAALDKAERSATDRTAKAGAAEWLVAQAEIHLRGLDGRSLAPADEAERARLMARAAVRAALGAGGR